MDNPEQKNRPSNNSALSLGFNIIGGMVIFSLLGAYFDKHFHTQAIGIIVGIFLGFLYGGYEVWKTVKQIDTSSKNDNKKNKKSS